MIARPLCCGNCGALIKRERVAPIMGIGALCCECEYCGAVLVLEHTSARNDERDRKAYERDIDLIASVFDPLGLFQ